MRFNFNENDIREIEIKHPTAYAFLLNRSLENEFKHLETNYIILNAWEKQRHAELKRLFEDRK